MSADFPAGTATALGVIGTASVDPSSSSRPLVFLASTDPELLRVFGVWLDLRARVETVGSVRLEAPSPDPLDPPLVNASASATPPSSSTSASTTRAAASE